MEVFPKSTLDLPSGEIISSPDVLYMNVEMDEMLFEGGRSIRSVSSLYLSNTFTLPPPPPYCSLDVVIWPCCGLPISR